MDPTQAQNGEKDAKKGPRVIIPPPEIKAVVDKTAAYVAKNGYSFEALIMKVEQNNPKFNFLRHADDPYRPYYQQKLIEFSGEKDQQQQPLKEEDKQTNVDGTLQQKTEQETQPGDQQQQQQESQQQTQQTIVAAQKPRENELQRQLKQAIFGDIEEKKEQLRPPPADQFNISHPVLANIDMDVIKLTAQFVARNGQKFLQGLTEREQRNPQFDFLKPTHGLFGYFTQLVESYSKVLIPRNEQLQKLTKFAQDPMEILKQAGERYLWDKMQDEELKKRADAGIVNENVVNEEQMQVDQIEWHDFVVVEKIDLYDDEEMKMMDEEDQQMKEQEKIKDQIMQQIAENQEIINAPQTFMERPQQVQETAQAPSKEIVISTALDPQMKIKTNYQRKTEDKKTTGTQKCPKCQQEIPISEWREHMRLELMDPKWLEEKKKREERAKLNSLASGDEIAQNLKRFASERKDIFPQAAAGGQIQEEQEQTQISGPQQRIIWDGIASNITRTTANIAMLHHQQQKNLQEAYEVRGTLDPKSLEKLTSSGVPQNLKAIQNQILQKEVQPKTKTGVAGAKSVEDDEDESFNILQGQLRSESEWIRLFPGKINIQIKTVPYLQEPQFQIKGQSIPMTVDSRMTVAILKEKLSSSLGGIHPSRIRLRQMQNLAMRDQHTLAFFNVPDGANLTLTVK